MGATPLPIPLSRGLALGLALGALAAQPAWAGKGAKAQDLRHQWPDDQDVRVHVQSTVAMPNMLRIELPSGKGVRVTVVDLEYVARCAVVGRRVASVELECPLEVVRLSAQPIREEEDRTEVLQGILDNYTARLDEAWLQVEVGQDGRLRHFDLEDVQEKILGDRQESELFRRLFRQGFAGFEVLVPPRATGKEWESRNPRVTEHLVWPGTNGHTQVDNRIVQVDGGRVWVESEGHGTIKPGPNRFLGVEVRSDAIFDTALGIVEEVRWSGYTQPLPSYIFAWNEMTRPYMFWGQARVAPIDAPVQIDAGAPLGDVVIPADLQQRMEASERRTREARAVSEQTGGVLAPVGRAPQRSDRFAFFRLGAVGGIAGDITSPVDVDLGGGLRLPADVWLSLGGRAKVPLTPEGPGTVIHHDHDLFLRASWSPLYRVSPHVGMVAGTTLRSWRGDLQGFSVAPMVGPELGLRARVGHGVWLDGWIRSTAEAGAWNRGGWRAYGASGALLNHRAGLSLVLGPGR